MYMCVCEIKSGWEFNLAQNDTPKHHEKYEGGFQTLNESKLEWWLTSGAVVVVDAQTYDYVP